MSLRHNALRRMMSWMMLLSLLLLTYISSISAKMPDVNDYPACPIHFKPQYFCCTTPDGRNSVLYTQYRRPSGSQNSFAPYYERGWNQARQVNFPRQTYTPSSPIFHYGDPKLNCRVNPNTKSLVCSEASNTELDNSVFMANLDDWRNNNATCPEDHSWESLMQANNVVNATAVAACKANTFDENPRQLTVLFPTFTEWPLLLLYSAYILCIVAITCWYVVQRRKAPLIEKFDVELAKTPMTGRSNNQEYHSASGSIATVTNNKKSLQQTGYVDSPIGSAVLAYIYILTIGLNMILVLCTMDLYSTFAPYTFFNPESQNLLRTFVTVWHVTALWLAILLINRSCIRNFFRQEVSCLSEATYIYIVKRNDGDEAASAVKLHDFSGISDLVARIEGWVLSRSKKQSCGNDEYSETVCVQKSKHLKLVFIEFQHIRYLYSDRYNRFVAEPSTTATALLDTNNTGLSSEQHVAKLERSGPNAMKIPMPSVATSILNEFSSAFYIYQLMAYYVWYYYNYWNMGLVMTSVVLISAIINVVTTRRRSSTVVSMTQYSTKVKVFRDGKSVMTVDSCDLVPGDLVEVQENWKLPCDIVLVKGSTVCDESMLTGESMPVQKFAATSTTTDVKAKNTLFCGTSVLCSGRLEILLGKVLSTGACTSKGKLVQHILYPAPMKFKYNEHMKFLVLVLIIYGIGASAAIVILLLGNENLENALSAWAYCIFMLCGCVSPLLPVVMTVGQVNAAGRLEKLGVFALNAQRIGLAGKTRVFCFDKTGTLTKKGLDFLGCVSNFEDVTIEPNVSQLSSQYMQYALASCHALGSVSSGELVGNQVELKMFAATEWKLLESEGDAPIVTNPDGTIRLQVVKRFEFDHQRMTMSVVMRNLKTGELYVFCKGAFEKMKDISSVESLPKSYSTVANSLAKDRGCYVLAMSMAILPPSTQQNFKRDDIESNLKFLGLFMFRNELKPDTAEAISKLREGDTRVIMITGDNAMCGSYIARECGMVAPEKNILLADLTSESVIQWKDINDPGVYYSTSEIIDLVNLRDDVELAVTGPAFELLFANDRNVASLLLHTRIFSRMTPGQKERCVRLHMEAHGIVTGMCGDGGNDCSALRIAHVGVALSDADASVVSPFTSKSKTINSVVDLCREGRCSVATSFASVKMLIMFGLISSTLRFIAYYHGVILSEWCCIFCDGFVLVGVSYTMTLATPLATLGKQRPTFSLIGPTTIGSILGQELINVIFMAFQIRFLKSQVWYCPFMPENIDVSKWWELSDNAIATCIFFTCVSHQLTASLVLSFGSRFRRPVWTNYRYCVVYAGLVGLTSVLLLAEPNAATDLFRIASSTNVVGLPDIPLPSDFRLSYYLLLLANTATVVAFEYFVILGPVRDLLRKKFHTDRIPMQL